MKRLFLLLNAYCLLSAADHRFSQSDPARHQKVLEYFYQREDDPEIWREMHTWAGTSSQTLAAFAKAGITFASSFVTDMLGNPVGGKARGFAYAGSYGLSMNVNLIKLGLKNSNIYSSAVWRTGTNLSARKIDNQFPVAQVYGSQTVKLNELYFNQTFFNNNLAIKLGRLDAGNDFLASPLYWKFVNNAFDGNPISIFFNVPFTAYPNSTWGAFLSFKPYKRLSAKFGVYNANSYIKKNKYHGINFTFKSTNGLIWITEWCGLVNQEREDRGMPGNYKAGFFYLTGDEPKFTGGKQKGDPCFYLLFDQMIYRRGGPGSDCGLTPFVSLIFAPENRNIFPFFVDCGLVFKGLFKNRPDDFANIGYVYGKYSPILADVQRAHHLEPQNFESVIELNYWIQVTKWFYIAPDMQYIIHPKGRNTPNAYVIGAQIGMDLW
jgi:porin